MNRITVKALIGLKFFKIRNICDFNTAGLHILIYSQFSTFKPSELYKTFDDGYLSSLSKKSVKQPPWYPKSFGRDLTDRSINYLKEISKHHNPTTELWSINYYYNEYKSWCVLVICG
jgi:hypothetical protein